MKVMINHLGVALSDVGIEQKNRQKSQSKGLRDTTESIGSAAVEYV